MIQPTDQASQTIALSGSADASLQLAERSPGVRPHGQRSSFVDQMSISGQPPDFLLFPLFSQALTGAAAGFHLPSLRAERPARGPHQPQAGRTGAQPANGNGAGQLLL